MRRSVIVALGAALALASCERVKYEDRPELDPTAYGASGIKFRCDGPVGIYTYWSKGIAVVPDHPRCPRQGLTKA